MKSIGRPASSSLTTHHSPLFTHHSPFTIHHSPFTIFLSQFPATWCFHSRTTIFKVAHTHNRRFFVMKTTSLIMLVLKVAIAATVLFLSTTMLFAQEKVEKVEKLD